MRIGLFVTCLADTLFPDIELVSSGTETAT